MKSTVVEWVFDSDLFQILKMLLEAEQTKYRVR